MADPDIDIEIIEQPKYLWRIEIGGPNGMHLHFESKPPMPFWRFMYHVLLGWEVFDEEAS